MLLTRITNLPAWSFEKAKKSKGKIWTITPFHRRVKFDDESQKILQLHMEKFRDRSSREECGDMPLTEFSDFTFQFHNGILEVAFGNKRVKTKFLEEMSYMTYMGKPLLAKSNQ